MGIYSNEYCESLMEHLDMALRFDLWYFDPGDCRLEKTEMVLSSIEVDWNRNGLPSSVCLNVRDSPHPILTSLLTRSMRIEEVDVPKKNRETDLIEVLVPYGTYKWEVARIMKRYLDRNILPSLNSDIDKYKKAYARLEEIDSLYLEETDDSYSMNHAMEKCKDDPDRSIMFFKDESDLRDKASRIFHKGFPSFFVNLRRFEYDEDVDDMICVSSSYYGPFGNEDQAIRYAEDTLNVKCLDEDMEVGVGLFEPYKSEKPFTETVFLSVCNIWARKKETEMVFRSACDRWAREKA